MKQRVRPKKGYRIFIALFISSFSLVFYFKDDCKNILNRNISTSKSYWHMTPAEVKTLPKYDRPDLAMLQNFLMTKDPKLNYPPSERKIEAYKVAKDFLRRSKTMRGAEAASSAIWTERGPNNVGGRTRALMFDPNDVANGYKKVFAGGVSGGLWYNMDITDPESGWQSVDDFMANLAISSIAYDPTDTDIFYIGTGEGWFNADAVRGAGIWKSGDRGVTWSQLPSTSNSNFYYVQKIVISANGTILAATRTGVYRSDNDGSSWSKVISGRGADLEVASNGDIYSSIGIFSSGSVHKSTDDGLTWQNITPEAGGERIELATAPSNEMVLYAVASSGITYSVAWFKKSSDGGISWSDVTYPKYFTYSGGLQKCVAAANDFTRGQAWYDLILKVHPENEDMVIAGGVDLHRTSDAGANWQPISYWTGACAPYVHADQHAIAFRPGNSEETIFGHDGGVAYSANITDDVPAFSTRIKGYNVTQFYACAAKNEINSHYFLAGAQDNGSQQFKKPGINASKEVTGGDGAFCFIDQDNADFQITSYVYNSYYLSTDGGNGFFTLSDGNNGRFINPSDYDSKSNVLYAAAGDNNLFRISNINGTPEVKTIGIDLDGNQISAVTISPYTDNRIFVGTGYNGETGSEGGKIFMIDSANSDAPIVTDISGALPKAYISSIAIGADDNQLLLTYSNYGVNSVWETTNGGVSWLSKEGNLPDMPVRWAIYNPSNRSEVLLATEVGIWATGNLTALLPEWVPAIEGLANVRCDMLKYREADGLVVVATHGRGLFTTDIFSTVTDADFATDKTINYVNFSVKFVNASLGAEGSWEWDFGDGNFSSESAPSHSYANAGIYDVSLTINDGADVKTKQIHILPSREVSYLLADGGNFETNGADFGVENVSGTSFEAGSSAIAMKSGTASGKTAWVTGISESIYSANMETMLYSPDFSFTTIGSYTLEFKAKFAFEEAWDGFVVEYSTDGGNKWLKLGNTVSASWYNTVADAQNGIFPPGEPFFSGTTSDAFVTKSFNVSFLKANKNVAFRFVVKSDGFVEDVGLAIDDFKLIGPDPSPAVPDFIADVVTAGVGQNVTFTSTSTGTITNYLWSFGENALPATATGAGPHTVSYNATGSYSVSLTVNDTVTKIKGNFITVIGSGTLPADKNIYALPGLVCPGLPAGIVIEHSEVGVSYQLRVDEENTLVGSPVVGDGNTLNLPTDVITNTTVFNMLATTSEGYERVLTKKPVVEVKEVVIPQITMDGSSLFASEGDGYQWYFEGGIIEGATKQKFSPNKQGDYTVEVLIGECFVSSLPFESNILGINGQENSFTANIYPNPTRGNFTLSVQNPKTGTVVVKVFNPQGLLMKQTSLKNTAGFVNYSLDFNGLANGTYFIQVETAQDRQTKKLIKTN